MKNNGTGPILGIDFYFRKIIILVEPVPHIRKESFMNKFDAKVFRKHYGRNYFLGMYIGFAVVLLLLQLIFYPSAFGSPLNLNLVKILTTLILIVCVVSAVSGYLYFVSRNKAKNQQIWCDGNDVYMREEKRIKRNLHTYTYRISRNSSSEVKDRFIHVQGKIHKTDETDHSLLNENINELFIPRCFTNEDKVLKLLRV